MQHAPQLPCVWHELSTTRADCYVLTNNVYDANDVKPCASGVEGREHAAAMTTNALSKVRCLMRNQHDNSRCNHTTQILAQSCINIWYNCMTQWMAVTTNARITHTRPRGAVHTMTQEVLLWNIKWSAFSFRPTTCVMRI
jgi:hypothetical protein